MISCCGVTLPALEAEQADEEHQIKCEKIEDEFFISMQHPMTKEHYISFVVYCTGERFESVKPTRKAVSKYAFSAEVMERCIGIVIIMDCLRNEFREETMKVTVFNGSPAGCNSATNVIASAFLKGAMSAGAETENIFLSDYHITQCQGALPAGLKHHPESVMQDDRTPILKKKINPTIVCFATPVYTWNMTALLKNFCRPSGTLEISQD